MCGIVGLIGQSTAFAPDEQQRVARNMASRFAARGPDADGVWQDSEAAVTFGHRRLSIVDLSAAGAQPMQSQDGRFVITFNGEIYNADDLRRDLPDHPWRGSSDTEVLLEHFARFGTETLAKLDGMFAFAIYDRKHRTVTLARDPFGEKPLYWGRVNGQIVFTSQLQALAALPGFAPAHNPAAIAAYFKYSYVPAPISIYQGIQKLPAAHMLTIRVDEIGEMHEPVRYWDAVDSAISARRSAALDDAQKQVETCLTTSVQRRLMSDVPLGALLSGGIDSSLTVALMQKLSGKPVKTFTIGMPVEGFNEAETAAAVAAHLGTDHHELMLTPQDVFDAVPTMAAIYDEPFSDSSQVPTYLVSKMAREQVTVALTGDGADELFGGYNRYIYGQKLARLVRSVPYPMRKTLAALLTTLPAGLLKTIGPASLRSGRGYEKLQKLARLVSARDTAALQDRFLATSDAPETVLQPDMAAHLQSLGSAYAKDPLTNAMLHDTLHYMPDDILVKTDRAAMANSLELRTPYLSRDVFQLAWALPDAAKIDNDQGKAILRQILYRHVPQALVDRPKAGFAIPLGTWLRGPLKDWAGDLLTSDGLTQSNILRGQTVQARWQEHLTGKKDHETFLWSVLMFQSWLDREPGP